MQTTDIPKGQTDVTPKARSNGHKLAVETKESLERAGSEVRRQLKEPTTGAAVVGAAVLGAAIIWGLPEAILGAAAGLIVHRILKRQQRSTTARAEQR